MKRLVLLTTCLLLTGTAHADTRDEVVIKFIDLPGFERVDIDTLNASLASHWIDTDTAPSAVGPIEKAVLIATGAIPSTRTRTEVSFGAIRNSGSGSISAIEVRHYNLGPLIRDEAIASYDNVADLPEFGLGDHMAWRFVFVPSDEGTPTLTDAARRTISQAEANQEKCSGRWCLDFNASFDMMLRWRALETKLPTWPALYLDREDEIATPAQTVADLAVLGYWANAESGHYQWTGGEHPEGARGVVPFRFIGIDRNLGQEAAIDAVWHETRLNDDELAEIYFRRAEIAGEVSLMLQTVVRPGY